MYIRVPVPIDHTVGESTSPAESGSIGSLTGFGQAPAPGLPNLSDWKELIGFRPSEQVQKTIIGRSRLGHGLRFHRIEDAASQGPVNLDYYPVKVSRLPQIPSVSYPEAGPPLVRVRNDADAFLRHIRLNINAFIDKRLTWFSPLEKSDESLWISSNPLGAVLHLDFYLLGGAKVGSIPMDDGSVVVSDFKSNYWRVYTIWTPTDHGHPVSGVREWGYSQSGSDYIFYTKAADRITKSLALPFKEYLYDAQNQLWLSFQRAIAMFVNKNGGKAEVLPPVANRYDWSQVAGQYHRPTINWL